MENGAGGGGLIVWVRRRNGSWWPGKILGPEELPASHLASPRTGTPVKLLGREDASVDWYNLEKSKRVKAFRCGEFDDCIERAESSLGVPPKKREKYARREDAILHALELEKELLRKQGKLDRLSNERSKSTGSAKKDSCGSDISNGKPGNTKSIQSRNQDTSIKGETLSSPVLLQKDQAGNLPSLENDHAEIIPRTREMQDMGLKIACAKQKLTSFSALDDDTLSPSTRVPSMGRPAHINGEQRMEGVLRAKRSKCMYFSPESFDVLDYKEILRNQIEMSPSHFLECDSYPFHRLLIEDDSSEFLEDIESGSSESTSSESESESDSSETEPDMDEDITSHSGATICMDTRLGAFQRLDTLGAGSMGQGESDESSLSGEMSHFYPHGPHSVNEAVSKWQLKGKRNLRNLGKRSMDASEIRGYNGYAPRLHSEERGMFRKRLVGQTYCRNHDFDDDVDVAGLSAKDFGVQMFGFDGTGSLYMPRDSSRSRDSFDHNIHDWEGMRWENHAAERNEWENEVWHFDPEFSTHRNFGGKRRSILIDVDLNVQASYQKEPVPIVSLMSKLDGKAIIGHPIQIEALDDNSIETLLSANGYFSNGLMNYGYTSLPPAWRTAKRTNFRVPRPHRSFALGSYEGGEYHSLNHERKPPFKKYNVVSPNHSAALVKKSISHVPVSPTDRQLQRKLPKKVSLFSSPKTRTLSSIGIEHTLISRPIHDSRNCQMEGSIKPESSGLTTVACIPVKLVFSRLLEKINRPPSKTANKVILSTSDAVRDPS
ncbi:hypothetical protein ERO13_A13G155200v2 [Gossypium hirsutum]|uniref:Uncharacterized protein At1g51745 n=2 Tax=Gossypium TaxID=3633 RepID=A0A1U8K8A4_GOSHI|nr:uncharacterized protein At1g51745-like [Gossypium hirsutum]KAG4166802.1 hypothetical protein ERO13_A13G155200v2 [Gossypium hirsutum]KAG4166803.1 hypothetical protein ERO13_A13G155200v2 [Gossypium hirsutum]TYH92517.1 hypothetical protein ES332_A13G186700v1 [Gossypium tomentosum]TYH92518.1 hypothetical protein ES332_A13G186700v1 [Gossypium tomentosum]